MRALGSGNLIGGCGVVMGVRRTSAIPIELIETDPAEIVWSIDDVVRAEYAPLVRLATLLVGSRHVAEELVQDACARLVVRGHRITEPGAWLRVAVLNACRNERRRLGRARRAMTRLGARRPHDVAAVEPPDDVLAAAVDRLPHDQREVVVLRFHLDLPEAEVAAMLDLPVGTVKSRTSRALTRLRADLAGPAGGES
jgi:RNA polymerase sigma factor (sigma-70 family)